jgi:hypothetical protein
MAILSRKVAATDTSPAAILLYMKRSFAWLLAMMSCGGTVEQPTTEHAPTQATANGVGSPCVFDQEQRPDFRGFDEREVNIEDARQAGGLACLANHFRGFVSRPESQCAERPAEATVYRSCRCANADGQTDDGAAYCACPDDFPCTPLVTEIGPPDTISGSYCIKRGTVYDATSACR